MLYDIAFVKKAKYGPPQGGPEGSLIKAAVEEPESLITTVHVTADNEKQALIKATLQAVSLLKAVDIERVEALIRPFSMKG